MKPDTRKTSFTSLKPREKLAAPVVIVGKRARKIITAIVNLHTEEIGFMGIVDEREDGSFFIRDVFYPKHSEANGGTCEISAEGECEVAQWLIERDRDDDVGKLKFWGHSHVNMGTSPSGQDENQAIELMLKRDYILRAICNKAGEMSISLFDIRSKRRFDNIKWTEEDDTPSEFYQGMVDSIDEIIDSRRNPKNKLKEVLKIVSIDTQMNEIVEKITELKKVNIPSKKPAANPSTGTDNKSKQRTLFNRSGHQEHEIMEPIIDDYPPDSDDVNRVFSEFDDGGGR